MTGFGSFLFWVTFLAAAAAAPLSGFAQGPKVQAHELNLSYKWSHVKGAPCFLVLGGFEEADRVLSLFEAPLPVTLASFDYPFKGPRKPSIREAIALAPEFRAAFHSTLSWVDLAASEMAKNPKCGSLGRNPSRVGLIGASFGSPFVIARAAHIPEVSHVVLIHAFSDVETVAKKRLTQIFEKKGIKPAGLVRVTTDIATYFGLKYLALPDFGAAARALRPDQHVLMLSAREDEFIPEIATTKLRAAIEASQAKSEIEVLAGGHLMPGDEHRKKIEVLTQRSLRWMKQRSSH